MLDQLTHGYFQGKDRPLEEMKMEHAAGLVHMARLDDAIELVDSGDLMCNHIHELGYRWDMTLQAWRLDGFYLYDLSDVLVAELNARLGFVAGGKD